MSKNSDAQYDVVIIGGGMVGASLACVLETLCEKVTLKILLVEALAIVPQNKPAQPSFDARSTVLSAGTVEYLVELNLWQALEKSATAIDNIHVSDQGKFGAVRMAAKDYAVEALGYVVENQALGTVLNSALLSAANIELASPATVKKIQPGANSVSLTIVTEKDEREITSNLVVLAEGGRSGLCEQLGIYRSREKYQQTAIIANVAFSSPHKNIAYERFTNKGPLALLPLQGTKGENRAALVWTHTSDNGDDILDLNDHDFLQKLQTDFGSRLGDFTRVGIRKSFPLYLEQAEEQVRHGVVLLGNVAHSLHPVAGQGFNLAFRDTMRLAQNISASMQRQENPGTIVNLQAYLAQTETDQDKTVAFSHYMTSMFSSDNFGLSWARKFGLLSVDLLPPLKAVLARQAMGLADASVRL